MSDPQGGNDPALRSPSVTEDGPTTPSWVETELDEVLAPLPARPTIARLRIAYLDCLAGIGGPSDAEAAHDRCRARFLRALREEGIGDDAMETLDHGLAALEAELTART